MNANFFWKSWNDAGAPVFNENTVGNFIPILDWALDTGVGTHWEKVFTGTNKAVYRATGGERWYLRVDDTNAAYVLFRMYETMSDVDTGTNPCPNDTTLPEPYFAITRGDSLFPTRDRHWHLFGDDRRFYFMDEYDVAGGQETTQGIVFGEMIPLDPLDNYKTVLMAPAYLTTDVDNPTWASNSMFPFFGGHRTDFNSATTDITDGLVSYDVTGTNVGCNLALSPQFTGSGANSGSAPLLLQPVYLFSSLTPGSLNGSATNGTFIPRYRAPYWYVTPYSPTDSITELISIGYNDFVNGSETFRSISGSLNTAVAFRIAGTEPGT